jgi:hypothetical protein
MKNAGSVLLLTDVNALRELRGKVVCVTFSGFLCVLRNTLLKSRGRFAEGDTECSAQLAERQRLLPAT